MIGFLSAIDFSHEDCFEKCHRSQMVSVVWRSAYDH